MNNSSLVNDSFEQNFICTESQTFCETLGITFAALSIAGFTFNSTLIALFLKFGYCKRDHGLILSMSLLLCDCIHLFFVIIHIAPELIIADPEKNFDWWDVTTNFIVFYVWIVNLFTLAYMCFVRYNATCNYSRFQILYQKKNLLKSIAGVWIIGLLICILPILHLLSVIPIFSINISLAHEMNHSNEDQYLEYILHFLNIAFIIFTVALYSKCILHIRKATVKVTNVIGTATVDNLAIKRRKRNLRLIIHYSMITLTFILLVFSWMAYKIFDATYFIVSFKKTAYFANSVVTGLIFTLTNNFVVEDFLTFVCTKSPKQENVSTKTNHRTTRINADNVN